MSFYLCRFGLGIMPAMYRRYQDKQDYIKAIDVPTDDLLVRKILGEHHTCRWDVTDEDEHNASASGSTLFGYPIIHMSKQDFATQEGIKAHELCHIKNHDVIVNKLILGMTFATTSIALKRCMGSSSNIGRRFGKNILRETLAISAAFGAAVSHSRYIEKRADLMGFSFCSKEGQAEVIQFFRKAQQKNIADLKDALNPNTTKDYAQLAQFQQELQKCLAQPESENQQKRIELLQTCIDLQNTIIKSRESARRTLLDKGRRRDYFMGMVSFGIAENGDYLNDKLHPLFSERIAYLEQAYRDLHGENPP